MKIVPLSEKLYEQTCQQSPPWYSTMLEPALVRTETKISGVDVEHPAFIALTKKVNQINAKQNRQHWGQAKDRITQRHAQIQPLAASNKNRQTNHKFKKCLITLATPFNRAGKWLCWAWEGAWGLSKYMSGLDQTQKRTILLRLKICETCELSMPRHIPVYNRHCGKFSDALLGGNNCGCHLGRKTAVASSRCPQKKW